MSQIFQAIFRLWLCACPAVRQETNAHLLSPFWSTEHHSAKRTTIPLKAACVCTQLRGKHPLTSFLKKKVLKRHKRSQGLQRWPAGNKPEDPSSNSHHLGTWEARRVIVLAGAELSSRFRWQSLSQGNKAESARAGCLIIPWTSTHARTLEGKVNHQMEETQRIQMGISYRERKALGLRLQNSSV